MLAIVDNRPRVLSLLEVLRLLHRASGEEVVDRRTEFELRKAEERAHILEGYVIALDNLDAVIKLIRARRAPEEARAGLMARFELSRGPGPGHSRNAAAAPDRPRAGEDHGGARGDRGD